VLPGAGRPRARLRETQVKHLATLHSNRWPYLLPGVERSVVVAYVLWMVWGVLGVHRFYLGKFRSGLAFAFTFGLLGLGWLYDGLTMPAQVARCNRRLGLARGPGAAAGYGWRGDDPMHALLAGAAERNGCLTVTEGVLVTGLPFERVETLLRGMVVSGYVDVRNDPRTGVVQYVFPELEREPTEEERPA